MSNLFKKSISNTILNRKNIVNYDRAHINQDIYIIHDAFKH